MPATRPRRIHIPVRNVDGVWECEFGGVVPVRRGADAELVLDATAISDPGFVRAFDRKEEHQVLRAGARLLMAVTIKPGHRPRSPLAECVTPYAALGTLVATERMSSGWQPDTLAFVEVGLAPRQEPREGERRARAQPGLWLVTQGLRTKEIKSGPITLPPQVSDRPATSLNHALTILSETYETWRISNTGNVYDRVFYMAASGRWLPLDALRDHTLEAQEKAIAGELWCLFMQNMTTSRASGGKRR